MRKTEYDILNLFKGSPSSELSTTKIVKAIFPEEYQKIRDDFDNIIQDNDRINNAKHLKAQLHRKTLYYLNKLVDEKVLRITKEGVKGEKYFTLTISEGEEVHIGKYKTKLIISRPSIPGMPIEGYERKGISFKYEPATWIDRLNAVLLECCAYGSLDDLFQAISLCFTNVNDVVGLNDFEFFLMNSSSEDILSFFNKLESECVDYGKEITCIINMKNIKPPKSITVLEYLESTRRISIDQISFVFAMNSKDLQDNSKVLSKVIAVFARSKIRMYVQNTELHKSPYMLGRAGPYTFEDKEWASYELRYRDRAKGIACSQSTIAIDVDKFLKELGMNQFRPFVTTVAKSLLFANSLQRNKSEEYFKNIISMNKNLERQFFYLSKNYIRFWNYGWKQEKVDPDLVVNLIKSCSEEINAFCRSQESIYLACGMPIRFRILFSCAFKEFNEREFSSEKFTKIQVRSLEDMYLPAFKESLKAKEKIFQIFDGGDRLRIYRTGTIEVDEIIREFGVLLNSYNIPLFCYDFGDIRGANLKLTSFIE
jgi:hypothetical protein